MPSNLAEAMVKLLVDTSNDGLVLAKSYPGVQVGNVWISCPRKMPRTSMQSTQCFQPRRFHQSWKVLRQRKDHPRHHLLLPVLGSCQPGGCSCGVQTMCIEKMDAWNGYYLFLRSGLMKVEYCAALPMDKH